MRFSLLFSIVFLSGASLWASPEGLFSTQALSLRATQEDQGLWEKDKTPQAISRRPDLTWLRQKTGLDSLFFYARYAGIVLWQEFEQRVIWKWQPMPTPADEILRVFGLDRLRYFENVGVRLGPEPGTLVRRIRWTSRMTSENAFVQPQWLAQELSPVSTEFDVLYGANGSLIAIFPIIPPHILSDAKKLTDLNAHYLNLAPYRLVPFHYDDPLAQTKWAELVSDVQQAERLIRAYLHKAGSENYLSKPEYRTSVPYVIAEVDPEIGVSLHYLDPHTDKQLPSLFMLPEEGTSVILFPRFPTVYQPTQNRSDRAYHEFIAKTSHRKWDGRMYGPLPHQDIVMAGPGTGIDVYLRSLTTKETISVIGRNPFEIANVRYLARLAGFKVHAFVGDNLTDDQSRFRFPFRRMKMFAWNTPSAYIDNSRPDHLPRIPSALMQFHDQLEGPATHQRLASALKRFLHSEGVVLLWIGGSIDAIKEIFRTAGFTVETVMSDLFRSGGDAAVILLRHSPPAALQSPA